MLSVPIHIEHRMTDNSFLFPFLCSTIIFSCFPPFSSITILSFLLLHFPLCVSTSVSHRSSSLFSTVLKSSLFSFHIRQSPHFVLLIFHFFCSATNSICRIITQNVEHSLDVAQDEMNTISTTLSNI